MTSAPLRFALTAMEVRGLADLIAQFDELLEAPDAADPGIARLAPNAYPDDDEAAREFRRLTEGDLLARRRVDAGLVAASLPAAPDADDDVVEIPLDEDTVEAWLRTLGALRLVLAARLDIGDTDEHHPDDPRYGVYDWIGYRLSGLLDATEP